VSYLDDDFNKLIHYAKSMGIKVTIKDYVPYSNDAGYWLIDGSEIQIMKEKKQSKSSLILTLLHELAHHMSWVYSNKKFNPKYTEAMDKEAARKKGDPFVNKRLRKAVYIQEVNDTKYQQTIAFEVGLKLPKWKIDLEIACDCFIYEYYYLNGVYPKSKVRKANRKELRKKIKNEQKN
jgi:hypothetical protein